MDHQRNPDIRNRLNVDNTVEDKFVSKEMVRPPGTNGQKPPPEDGFPVPTSRAAGYRKTKTKIARPRAP
jgi:hypothetical protein